MTTNRRPIAIELIHPLLGLLAAVFLVNPRNAWGAASILADDFNPHTESRVLGLAIQPDGRVLGAETDLGRVRRYYPDGTVDSGFDAKISDKIFGIILESDDRMLVSSSITVKRLRWDGSIDAGFNPAGLPGPVQAVALQDNKGIWVGGGGLARLQTDGSQQMRLSPAPNDTILSVLLQPDGKILLGGYFTTVAGQSRNRLARLNSDGTLDASFNAQADGIVRVLLLQPDGKILVAGSFTALNGESRAALGRLTPEGTLDAAFNPALTLSVATLALQANGKIIVGGAVRSGAESYLLRLHPDGSLDTGFRTASDGPVDSLALQPDGRILAAGDFRVIGQELRSGLARLLNNEAATHALTYEGSTATWWRDGSSPAVANAVFEHSVNGQNWTLLGPGLRIPGGWQLTNVTVPATGTLRARGKVTGGNGNDSQWWVEDYRGNPLFFSQPASQTNLAGSIVTFEALVADSSALSYQWLKNGAAIGNQANADGFDTNRLTLSGVLKADEGEYRLVLQNAFGSVTSQVARLTVIEPFITQSPGDASASVGESLTLQVTAMGTPPLSYEWSRQGVPLAGASNPILSLINLTAADAGTYQVIVTNAFGSVTSLTAVITVNAAIRVPSMSTPSIGQGFAMAVQTDGQILVGGDLAVGPSPPARNLIRYDGVGNLDSSFQLKIDNSVASIVRQNDGRILIGGNFTSVHGVSRLGLARLHPDGTLDLDFQPDLDGLINAIALQDDGKIVISGSFSTVGGEPHRFLARLQPDGAPDNTFNPSIDNPSYTLLIQPTGKILVGGSFTTFNEIPRRAIARIHPDGSLDEEYSSAIEDVVTCLAEDADGKLLVGGIFNPLAGQPRSYLRRLMPNGQFDSTFLPDLNDMVASIVVQTDGRILLGGYFTAIDGQLRSGLARLNGNGSLDPTFNPSTNSVVSALGLQADGTILVGGDISLRDGPTHEAFVRIQNTEPARQEWAVTPSTLFWKRTGTGPEVGQVTMDHSSDGLNWVTVGPATRTNEGWNLGNAGGPAGGTWRARGTVAGGMQNASGWWVEGYVGGSVIVAHPQSRTNRAGSNVRFDATVGGSGPWNVQWLKNGELYIDQGPAVEAANHASLTLHAVLHADAGAYQVVFTTSLGSVTSKVATLIVHEPGILAQPMSVTAKLGESATFNVTAAGTPPLSYQWYRQGSLVAGGNGPTLTLANLSATDIGFYSVVVSSAFGSITSAPALLTVNFATIDNTITAAADGDVRALAVQNDGKVLVGGSFHTIAGQPRNAMGRFNADGTLDASFHTGVEGVVHSIALQPDGKILVAGTFNHIVGFANVSWHLRNNLARLNADGSLDFNFDPSPNNPVSSLTLMPDGRMAAAGPFTLIAGFSRNYIAWIHPNGALDDLFSPEPNGPIETLAAQPDGQTLVAGSFTVLGGETHRFLGRITPSGGVDSSFLAQADQPPRCFALQADGKILIGGAFTVINGETRRRLARLHPDGTLDSGFNPEPDNSVNSIVVTADGKIIVGGSFARVAGQARAGLARLHSDGSIDGSFEASVAGNADRTVLGLAVRSDGRVLVGGTFTNLAGAGRQNFGQILATHPAAQSLEVDGATIRWQRGGSSPEVGFTTIERSADGLNWTRLGEGTRTPGGWEFNGAFPPGGAWRARGLTTGGFQNGSSSFVESYQGTPVLYTQPQSRTNLVGTSASFVVTGGPGTVRWFHDGVALPDPTEAPTPNSTSILTLSPVKKADEGAYHAVLSNGFGSVTSAVVTLTVPDPVIASQTGSQVRSVGQSVSFQVEVIGTLPIAYQWYHDGVALPGAHQSALTLANLTEADAGFYTVTVGNASGVLLSKPALLTINAVTIDSQFHPFLDQFVTALALQADGKILVGGSFTNFGGQGSSFLGRLQPDGTMDSTFAPQANNAVNSIAVQPDGRILVGGTFTSLAGQPRSYLGRLRPDGTLDSSFNLSASSPVESVLLQSDGKILVGGSFTNLGGQPSFFVGRLTADGAFDPTFRSEANIRVSCLALQPDGRILAGGYYAPINGPVTPNVIRLSSNGTLEPGFSPGPLAWVRAIAVQPDNKILIAGDFTTINLVQRRMVARLHPDGSLETGFNPDLGFLSSIRTMVLQTDGKILIGGRITSIGGESRPNVARLLPNGMLDGTWDLKPTGNVDAIAFQSDGQILLGGHFTNLLGVVRTYLSRVENNDEPVQSLEFDGVNLVWYRGGGSAEITRASFEHSFDGVAWSALGEATRIPGGWSLAGESLPQTGHLRARGTVVGGLQNASSWFTEATLTPPWPLRVRVARQGAVASVSWVGGHPPFQVQQTTTLDRPDSWQNIGAPVQGNSAVVPLTGTVFLRVRCP